MNILRITGAVALPLLIAAVGPARAEDAWVANHTMFRGDVVHSDDVSRKALPHLPFGALPTTRDVDGLEVKQSIYAGRALTERDVGPVSLVKVNMPVKVLWKATGLDLELNGRALESGALGAEIRVLNTATSRTIRATVTGDGVVEVKSAF